MRRTHRLRVVDLLHGPGAVHEIDLVGETGRKRFDELAAALQRLVDPVAQFPRGEPRLLRLRVERHDLAGLRADQVDHRAGHLPAALE